MTYKTEISKIEMLPFADVYDIQAGTREFRYTSFERDVVFGGNTYTRAKIESQPISEDDKLKANRNRVTMPVINPIGELIATTPLEPIIITCTRFFLHDESAFEIQFVGNVLGVTFVDYGNVGLAVADVESNTIFFRNKIPTVSFKSYCNNTLFEASDPDDPNCNLLDSVYEVSAIVSVSGDVLNSPSFIGLPFSDYFIGGHVKSSYGDFRYIEDHNNTNGDITLNVAFDSRLTTGATVLALPGCDKNPETCRDKFSNLDAFKGFPFIPSNNPARFGADQ